MDLVDSIEAGKLTLSELIDTLAEDENYETSKWNQRYREFTALLQQAPTFMGPETDDLVKRLWYERDNGIASIRQGVPSLAEYQQSLPLLRELTERIRQQEDECGLHRIGVASESHQCNPESQSGRDVEHQCAEDAEGQLLRVGQHVDETACVGLDDG